MVTQTDELVTVYRPLLTTTYRSLPNPAARSRINGGGEYGAAVAVAAGHAELALAVDELGSARVRVFPAGWLVDVYYSSKVLIN